MEDLSVSEFRQNILTKEWVIVAPERSKRPEEFARGSQARLPLPEHSSSCPFCSGNENMTPAPVYQIPESGDWQLRVVPNKYAALQSNADTKRYREGKYLKVGGYGIAEVIIESRRHNVTIATMEHDEVVPIARAYRERYRKISQLSDINLITIFRNHGERAGTSLEHPHSQIIATPIVPRHVREPVFQARMAFDSYGTCIFCDIIAEEIRLRERVICENARFIAFSPYASKSPFECRIMPKLHHCALGDMDDGEIVDFAEILHILLKKMYVGLENPDYNFIIRSAPTDDINAKHYHWYVVIIPKVTTPAGFEIGSGIYINVMPPEAAAQFLREIVVN